MRILLAIPTFGGDIKAATADSIANMENCGCEIIQKSVVGYGCAPARTRIVELACEKGCDRILMVDSDVELPPDALSCLLEHDVDVCLGYYATQGRFDGETCLCKTGRVNFDRKYNASEIRELRERGERLIEVKGGGLGCALIKTSVFERLAYPWFKWVDYADGHGTLSEDLYFCDECAHAGIKIHADTRVACRHAFRHWQGVE